MYFEESYLYHVYNQGNNHQVIFYNRSNYLFFLKKVKAHILPYADILAWCLMPNHFHFLILVNHTQITINPGNNDTSGKRRSLNDSIGILLRSYTRAVNNQEHRSGALFREETKAICLSKPEGVSPVWFNRYGITEIQISGPTSGYPAICYRYILNNPVRSGLVKKKQGLGVFFLQGYYRFKKWKVDKQGKNHRIWFRLGVV